MGMGNVKTKISVPQEMDGEGSGTNPDELLVGAACSCFLMTVAIGFERAGILSNVKQLSIASQGTVRADGGVQFEKIVHRLTVELKEAVSAEKKKELEDIVRVSEDRCMVSKALSGNVAVEVQLTIHPES